MSLIRVRQFSSIYSPCFLAFSLFDWEVFFSNGVNALLNQTISLSLSAVEAFRYLLSSALKALLKDKHVCAAARSWTSTNANSVITSLCHPTDSSPCPDAPRIIRLFPLRFLLPRNSLGERRPSARGDGISYIGGSYNRRLHLRLQGI